MYPSLQEVGDLVLEASADRRTESVPITELVGSMTDITSAKLGKEQVILTKEGFAQLTRRLNIPIPVFKHADVSAETKLQILRDCVAHRDDNVTVRLIGDRLYSVLSQEYAFFDNAEIIVALLQLQAQGSLPEDIGVMSYHIGQHGRSLNMRLVAPQQWNFVIGENGNSASFLGNFVIENDESAEGAFKAQVAVTRAACLNTTIGSHIVNVEHRFADRNEFLSALNGAANKLGDYANGMRRELEGMRSVIIEAPNVLFARLAKELKIPTRVMEEVRRYWQREGSGESMYHITQAIAAGTRVLGTGARPNWSRRHEIESQVWDASVGLLNMHAEGEDVNEWYLTGELGVQEMCAQFVEGYAEEIEEAPRLADGIRSLEVEKD